MELTEKELNELYKTQELNFDTLTDEENAELDTLDNLCLLLSQQVW